MEWFMMKNSRWMSGWHWMDLSDEECWIWVLLHCLASELDRGKWASRRGYFEDRLGKPLTTQDIADRIMKPLVVVQDVITKAQLRGKVGANSECFFIVDWELEQKMKDKDVQGDLDLLYEKERRIRKEAIDIEVDAKKADAGLPSKPPIPEDWKPEPAKKKHDWGILSEVMEDLEEEGGDKQC